MRFRSRLSVNLDLLGENVQKLRAIGSNEILFMVKADAYGHGVLPIVRFSRENLGIKEFGLATLSEALYLREKLTDLEFECYVFSDVQIQFKESAEYYLNARIIPVLSNEEDLDFFLSHKDFQHFPLCLHFNTGMNRLGLEDFRASEIAKKIKKAGRKTIYHLMSHLACASLPMNKNKRNIEQLQRFSTLKQALRDEGLEIERTSLANSGAIEQKSALDETHIRPGLMLYGPSSLVSQYRSLSCWQGQTISRLESYIIDVFKVEKGTPIGYGATPCFDKGLIAIIALGYGDGLSTRYQGAKIYHLGFEGTIAGRVNMDMAQVFFPQEALGKIKKDQFIEVWGNDSKQIDGLCEQTKMIPYELFCALTPRVPRVYHLDS